MSGGAVKGPAGITFAEVIVVFGTIRPATLSHDCCPSAVAGRKAAAKIVTVETIV
jgi:hypothetical protein